MLKQYTKTVKNIAPPIFTPWGKIKQEKGKCFWCGELLSLMVPSGGRCGSRTITRDHFVSKSLKRLLLFTEQGQTLTEFKGGELTCKCCSKCNHRRGSISSALAELMSLRDKAAELKETWFELRCNVMPDMLYFRDKIREKLPAEMAELCLLELYELGCPTN